MQGEKTDDAAPSIAPVETSQSDPAQTNDGGQTKWWRSFKYVSSLSTIVPAFVAFLTWGTNYSIERSKLAAQEDSRNRQQMEEHQARLDRNEAEQQARLDKNHAEQQARLDENAAAERALQTKYVDMALGKTLCIDYRARLFGYLASVLDESDQRRWATTELERAEQDRKNLEDLRHQLQAKREDSISLVAEFAQKFGKTGWSKLIADGFELRQRNNRDEIESLKQRIADAEGPPCGS